MEDDNEPILKTMHMYMYVYTRVKHTSIAKNSNFPLQWSEFPVMEWPSSQHQPPQLMPGHHQGFFFRRKWDLGLLQSKFTQIWVYNLKGKPQCTMQGSPKGEFLPTGDWFCEPKNIMGGVCEFLQFLLMLFQKQPLIQIKHSWIRGRRRERKMSTQN